MASQTTGEFDAHFLGVKSIPAAVIFAVLYIPLLAWFLRQSIVKRLKVFRFLTLFCALRVAAFIMRAIIAGSDSAAHKLSLYIAEQVVYTVGFVGLVVSTYELTLDRGNALDTTHADNGRTPFSRLARLHHAFRLIITLAIVLSIIGTVYLTDDSASKRATGKSLRTAGTSILFVLVVFVAFQTFVLIRVENVAREYHAGAVKHNSRSLGERHGHYVLSCIAALLVLREAFMVSTLVQTSHSTDERWFYPFAVLTEFLVVLFFLVPGLVPDKQLVWKDTNSEGLPMHQ